MGRRAVEQREFSADQSGQEHDPGARPRKRRRASRRKVGVAAGLVVALGTAGSWLIVARGGSSTTSGRAPASSTTSTEPEPEVVVRTATDAAQQLYFAWQRGDEASAALFASTKAISSVFAIPSTSAAGLAFDGCSTLVDDSSTCSWSRTDASLEMRVEVPASGTPQVQTVELS